MEDLVPSELFRRVQRLWWLLLLLMIGGGIAGILITRVQKPLYESQATITTSIDFAYAGRLSDDEEDYLISSVGDIIDSDEVLDLVLRQAANSGISLTRESTFEAFSKSRQGYRWVLSVRASSPELAQSLAQIWVDSAAQVLQAYRLDSMESLMLQSAMLALQNCFSQAVVTDPASAWCSTENLPAIRSALSEASALEGEGTYSSALMMSKISTTVADQASLPAAPALFGQNTITLAGAFCGLLLGLAFLFFLKPTHS